MSAITYGECQRRFGSVRWFALFLLLCFQESHEQLVSDCIIEESTIDDAEKEAWDQAAHDEEQKRLSVRKRPRKDQPIGAPTGKRTPSAPQEQTDGNLIDSLRTLLCSTSSSSTDAPIANRSASGLHLVVGGGGAAVSGDVVVPKIVLKHMLDGVERAAAAASHAVKISCQARDAFEEEHRRIVETAGELRRLSGV